MTLKEYCLKNDLLYLLDEWDYEANSDKTPDTITHGSARKASWKCKNGHKWEASVSNRAKGRGCPYCSNIKVWSGYNDLASKKPELVNEWHPTKNGDLLPTNIAPQSNKSVWWICPIGHEYQSPVINRFNGQNCPYCSNHRVLCGYNDLETINPAIAQQWHPKKNENLQPSHVTPNSNKKVWWLCDRGHEWQAKISHRNKGSGCPYCSGRLAIPGKTDLQSTNPTLAKEWAQEENGSLTPDSITPRSQKKVWWVCEKGHKWQSTVSNRAAGNNCPICSGHQVLSGYNDLATLCPALAKEWNFQKNTDITPSMVTIGSGKKIWWRCKKGHEWQSVICSRVQGCGCPMCSSGKQTSLPEQTIYYYIKQAYSDAINAYTEIFDNGMELDIFIPSANIAIEYDGRAWHKTAKTAEKELRKYKICQEKGILLIRLKETADSVIQATTSDIVIPVRFNHNLVDIDNALKLLEKHLPLIKNLDIDSMRDRNLIMSLYQSNMEDNSIATRADLISEWNWEKNTLITPNMFATKSNKKVWWKCKHGHEWQAVISDRAAGKGCPYCSGRMAIPGETDLKTTNPTLAAELHPIKNEGLNSTIVSAHSSKKVWWICSKGHEWQATISHRSSGEDCPYCSGHKVLKGFNDLQTLNPDLAAEWHPVKNKDISPDMLSLHSGKKVWWVCKKGHEWQATVDKRANGRGCPICYAENRKRKT